MILVDTHFHLLENEENIDKIIYDAKKDGVCYFILGGCSKKDNLYNIEVSKKYKNIYLSLGYHPDEASNITKDDIKYLKLKVSKGADVLYTQLFFNNNKYYDFAQRCVDNGIDAKDTLEEALRKLQ